jgi:hypothetical protein
MKRLIIWRNKYKDLINFFYGDFKGRKYRDLSEFINCLRKRSCNMIHIPLLSLLDLYLFKRISLRAQN